MKKLDFETKKLHEMIIKGCILAVTAPTKKDSKEVVKMVEKLCERVDNFTKIRLVKIAEKQMVDQGIISP